MFKIPKLNIPKQLFARNPMQRPSAPQPQPQPIARDQQPAQPPFFTGPFGEQIARVPQPAPQPATGLSGLGMFSNFRPLMQNPNAQQMPTASQSGSMGGMFSNFGPLMRNPNAQQMPAAGLGGFFGNPFIRAQQMPNFGSATGISAPQGSGLFGLGPQNPMQPTPPPSPQNIQNTMSTNFAAGMTPGMGFPAAPVQGGSATGVSAPPTGGLSSLGFS